MSGEPTTPPTQVFVSYSHADEMWKDVVVRHLDVVQAQGKIVLWDDRQITPGAQWLDAIDAALASASVGLLLVSANSLTSKFMLREEIPELLRRRASTGLHLIPVILRPCAWEEVDWLAAIQMFPRDGVPLSTLDEAGVDTALALLAREVGRLVSRATDGTSGSATPPPVPPASIDLQPPVVVARSPADPLAGYRQLKEVHRSRYGRVIKCVRTSDAQTCVVKQTQSEHVSPPALEAIAHARAPNVVVARRIWSHGDHTYEELPYVGGVPLADMITRGRGGLDGSVLESFHRQIDFSLARLHEAGVIHRDIHPANIYAVIGSGDWKQPHSSDDEERGWVSDYFSAFRLAWVIVDCTFATLTTEPSPGRYRHGSYTAEEQELGAPIPRSDMYSLGATLYFGITGEEPPPAHRRRVDSTATVEVPDVTHSYWRFSRYVEQLLSLDPRERGDAGVLLDESTVVPGYCSTLRLGEDRFLISDSFPTETEMLDREGCLAFHRERRDWWRSHGHDGFEHEYWVKQLEG